MKKAALIVLCVLAALPLFYGGKLVVDEYRLYRAQQIAVSQIFQYLATPIMDGTGPDGKPVKLTRADVLAQVAASVAAQQQSQPAK